MGCFEVGNRIITAGERPWGYGGAKGAALFSPGAKALRFAGNSTSYVQAPANNNLLFFNQATSPLSISFWAYITTTDYQGIFTLGSISYRTFCISSTSNSLELVASTDGSKWTTIAVPSMSYSLNKWTHIAVSRASSGLFTFYLDGVPCGTFSAGDFLLNELVLKLGAHYALMMEFMSSSAISDLRIYNEQKTGEELMQDSAWYPSKEYGGLVAAYPLDEMQGGIAHDVIGGCDATIYNSTWVNLTNI